MIWMPLPCSAVAQRMADGAGNLAGRRFPSPGHVFCLLACFLFVGLFGWFGWFVGWLAGYVVVWWCVFAFSCVPHCLDGGRLRPVVGGGGGGGGAIAILKNWGWGKCSAEGEQ